MNIHDFIKRKLAQEKLSMLTCYDANSASIASKTPIDALLVGDSVAMVVHGYPNTLHATLEMMELHTQAVARAAGDKLIIADLPFLSFRKGITEAMHAVERLMKAGAHAVKLEGLAGHADVVQHIVQSGVPVMGHLGLTPQSVHQLGGHKVQARDELAAQQLLHDAKQLEQLGCFSIVLECIPAPLAKSVTESLYIPTIGIGAGSAVDGQVLVWHDLLGLTEHKPKFLRHYFNGNQVVREAVLSFVTDVQSGNFPNRDESYS